MNLTDDQCYLFRALPVSFNDMVRAIYKAGELGIDAEEMIAKGMVGYPSTITNGHLKIGLESLEL